MSGVQIGRWETHDLNIVWDKSSDNGNNNQFKTEFLREFDRINKNTSKSGTGRAHKHLYRAHS